MLTLGDGIELRQEGRRELLRGLSVCLFLHIVLPAWDFSFSPQESAH
jgi:hypothetical protein